MASEALRRGVFVGHRRTQHVDLLRDEQEVNEQLARALIEETELRELVDGTRRLQRKGSGSLVMQKLAARQIGTACKLHLSGADALEGRVNRVPVRVLVDGSPRDRKKIDRDGGVGRRRSDELHIGVVRVRRCGREAEDGAQLTVRLLTKPVGELGCADEPGLEENLPVLLSLGLQPIKRDAQLMLVDVAEVRQHTAQVVRGLRGVDAKRVTLANEETRLGAVRRP